MKKLITTCVLLAAIVMVSSAQSKQAAPKSTAPQGTNKAIAANKVAPEQVASRRATMHKQQYGLNEEQYKGVYQAELDYQKQIDQIKATGTEPGEGQLMQAGMERDRKFKAAMAPDQYAKYEQTQKKTN